MHRSLSHSASNNKIYITTLLSPLTVDIWCGSVFVFCAPIHVCLCVCDRKRQKESKTINVCQQFHINNPHLSCATILQII